MWGWWLGRTLGLVCVCERESPVVLACDADILEVEDENRRWWYVLVIPALDVEAEGPEVQDQPQQVQRT